MDMSNLTALDGTEKQVTLAASIRARALADHQARIDGARAKGVKAEVLAEVEAKVARMAGIGSSRWWIDNGPLAAVDRLKRIDWVYRNAIGLGMEWVPA